MTSPKFFTLITTLISYATILTANSIRDFLIFISGRRPFYFDRRRGMPIISQVETLYIRAGFIKIADCFDRPITGKPGKFIKLLERKFDAKNVKSELTGQVRVLLNFGSYNYLGWIGDDSKYEYNDLVSASYVNVGIHSAVRSLEKTTAEFLKAEDAVVFPMGFATNTCTIPVFTDAGDLILSDQKNHTSIIYGCRLSQAYVAAFAHNDMAALEKTLVYWISQGQPVTHKSWKRIFLMVEGIYSMEGTILDLKKILELKRKYKFYLFIDEAHSIGAIGRTGRGICEYWDVDPKEIDILMGTYTKAFNGAGGYIAGSSKLIGHIRRYSDSTNFGEQMSPIIAMHIENTIKNLMTTYKDLPNQLKEKSNYMRRLLAGKGFELVGDYDSPVIPVMIYNPGKIGPFSRMCLERGLAVVVVGCPATPILESRVRLCVSASHTEEDIEVAVKIIEDVGNILGMRYNKRR